MRSMRSGDLPRSSSSLVVAADLVRPAYLSVPEYDEARTLGPEVAAVCTLAGFGPDPEQRMLHDASSALDKDGKSVAFEIVVIAPRQNIKTGFFKQYALGQLFVRQEPLTVWSAHEFDTAREALKDIEGLIDGSDILRRRVKRITHDAVPMVELLPKYGGARLKFKTRTSGGGRGLAGGKVIADEGYALTPAHTGALYPIMLAQPDPQICIGSSACRPESAVLWDAVTRGRAGADPRMVYAEWCFPPSNVACDRGDACDHERDTPGCGCDKPDLIEATHSAIRRGRIQLATIINLRKSMPPKEYSREVAGWHDSTVVGEAPIPEERWNELEDPSASMASVGAYAVEMSLDRAWASIGAAGPVSDGRLVVDLLERRRGKSWVVDRCVELKLPGVQFVVDGNGPAKSLIPDLEAAGLDVFTASAHDHGSALDRIVDATKAVPPTVCHGPQQELADAVIAAAKRSLGDGSFAVGRKVSTADVDAFIAVMFAHWAAAIADLEQRSRPNIRFL